MKWICISVAAFVMCGCASSGQKKITDEKTVARIKCGQSTKVDVERLLGKPASVDFTDAGREKWIYTYSRYKTRAASFVPVVGLLAGGADITTHTLTVLFREDEIVEKIGKGKTTGGGGSVRD